MSESLTLIPLGTAGWIPTGARETLSLLVETEDTLLLLDAGTGVRRLLESPAKEILERHDEVHVLLSHFHADHIFGFTFLPLIFAKKRVSIFGPGPGITGRSTEESLNTFLRSPIFPLPLRDFPMSLEIQDLHEGETRVGGVPVRVRQQVHTDPSIGLRLGDALTYVTDTPCEAETVAFARGSRMLLHECWIDRDDFRAINNGRNDIAEPEDVLEMHSHADGVARIGCNAGVERLGLVHLNPRYDEARVNRMREQCAEICPAAELLQDGVVIRLG